MYSTRLCVFFCMLLMQLARLTLGARSKLLQTDIHRLGEPSRESAHSLTLQRVHNIHAVAARRARGGRGVGCGVGGGG